MIIEKFSLLQPKTQIKRGINTENNNTYPQNYLLTNNEKSIVNNSALSAINFKAINFSEVEKLTDIISRRPCSKKQVIKFHQRFAEASGLTMGGGIPQAWLNRIKDNSKFNKEVFLEKLGSIFTLDRHFSDIDTLSENIQNLFKEQGIAQENDIVTTDYLGKGFFGRAYNVSINGEDPKVIKEFKRTQRYHNNHGNYAEQNIAEYINRYSESNSNMSRYYFGDTKNGIMINDFITDLTPLPKNIIHLDELGVAYDDDKPRNYVNGYIIDYGGIITVNNLVGNEAAQKIYSSFKNNTNNTEKLELFQKMYKTCQEEEFKEKDKLIGLTHSIKFLPVEEQGNWYEKFAELDISQVNVALVENIKNFNYKFKADNLIKNLTQKDDHQVRKCIARDIKYLPANIRRTVFEEYSLDSNNTIKKYLARNINHYYMNLANRVNIFDNIANGADTFANIALVNSLKWLGLEKRDVRFERFFNQNDVIVQCALARNIELFNDDEKIKQKWIDKLMSVDDVRVKRALCESIMFLDGEMRVNTFEQLLNVDDMNAKEFLAESITSVPYFHLHKDWFDKLVENADNSVYRALALNLKNIKTEQIKKDWTKYLLEHGDTSVKDIIKKESL